jgi:transcriptional regulator with XRE-family HTH domain
MSKKIRFKQKLFSATVQQIMFLRMAEQKRRIGLREFAKQIGISSATLSRIENGKTPDLETYFKLCFWMKKSTNEFYNH